MFERYKTIKTTKRYILLDKRLKRLQSKVSNHLNTKNYSKNYKKTQKKRRIIQRKINNIKQSHIDNTITDIYLYKPTIICIETLDINSMKKNDKYVAKGIQDNPFRKFLDRLEERSNKNNIKIIKIDKWYKSSKICSRCKNIKENLRLSDRIYKCDKCNLEIDRDYNASLNIRDYYKI